MTSEERLELIKQIAKKNNASKKKKKKRPGRPAKKKVESNFIPMEPTSPSHHDIAEEFAFLTDNNAEQFINYEQD